MRVAAGTLPPERIGELFTATVSALDGVHTREPAHTLIVAISPQRITTRVQFWHHPQHGVAVSSAVVMALAAVCAEHKLQASVTSALPNPPLTAAEVI